jgi:F0F1-type ATP synthase assembly protein I
MKTSTPVRDLGRFAGLGLQYALSIALLGALGWWIDGWLGSKPWCLVAGVVLGCVAGFAMVVRSVPGAVADPGKSEGEDPRR